jgi:REP element-mobilizing transposase RayT
MPAKKPQLVNGEIYHIVLRAVGSTVIFNNENDYYRGIFSLYEFNNAVSVEIRKRREERKKEKASGSSTSAIRDMFVEIFALAFMPNHIHLLVRQIKDNGITQFMRKLEPVTRTISIKNMIVKTSIRRISFCPYFN